jgi:hypothetical protein
MKYPTFLALATLLHLACPASALIKISMPVSKIYANSSIVLQGTITSINPDKRLIEADVIALKGAAPAPRIRLQLAEPPTLLDSVTLKSPLLVFIGRSSPDAIHLADTWLLAERLGQEKTAWRTIQEKKDAVKSFPGRTSDLTDIISRLAFGEAPLLDVADHTVFKGGLRDLGKLPVTDATALLTTFANSDSKPDLIVSTPKGHRLFLATPDGFEEATQPFNLHTLLPGPIATAIIDEKDGVDDLITPSAVYPVTDAGLQRPIPLPAPPTKDILAVGAASIAPLQLDPVLITPTGQAFVYPRPNPRELKWTAPKPISLWKDSNDPIRSLSFLSAGPTNPQHLFILRDSGPTRYTLNETNIFPSNFYRLTGEKLTDRKDYSQGLKNPIAIPLKTNQESQINYLILSDAGLLLLIDRGYGAYLINPTPTARFDPSTVGRILAPGDYDHDQSDDAYFLSPTGHLHVLTTSPN